MAKGLTGKRVVIGASRKTDEMSTLIEKQGGVPIVRSLQGTIFLAEKEVGSELDKLVKEGTDWAIFTTGIGTETLLDIAEKQGIKQQFINIIHHAKIGSRGYKTLSTLKKLGIMPAAVDENGTTKSLLKSLESFDFKGKRVTVQLHGEKAPTLIKFLEEKGADVSLILPYQHIPPETETVAKLCEELLEQKLDAVCFTTAIQVRSLFDFAREKDCVAGLLTSFKWNTLAVAVGKVTEEALREERVENVLVPEHERMGAMIIELSRYYRDRPLNGGMYI
ncbi:uroporphyrinogen-III synthase [Neobacillus sp. 179-J 1A1 HS]|uniref:uroporphyrinogen-III synthase n=1 Tax=Neobacillus driksii TaxID=3035913 RepID=UPI0035BBB526